MVLALAPGDSVRSRSSSSGYKAAVRKSLSMTRNLFEYHPVIGYRYIPRLRARVRHEGGGYLVRVNPQGFRSEHDFSAPKPNGRFRIAISGDSFTAGEGVSNGQRFSDLLERHVPEVELFNFALPGTGTDQQYLAFREYGAQLPFDLLLICPLVENIVRNLDRERLSQSSADGKLVMRPKPYFELREGRLELCHQPVPKRETPLTEIPADRLPSNAERVSPMRQRLRDLNDAVDSRFPGFREWTQRVRQISLPVQYRSKDDPGWILMSAILRRWIEESSTPAVLCPIPTFSHLLKTASAKDYQARFAELAAETGAELIDVLPTLWEQPPELLERSRFPNDEHPNRLGHELLTKALAPHLRRLAGQGRA